MSSVGDKIISLTKQLYPQGRAWKFPFDGTLENLHQTLAISEEQTYNDAVSILYAILPDNANFTVDDATEWEVRLGLIVNQLTPLADRKLAIKRKLNQPGAAPAKSNWRYLEEQLQAAGFNVYVFENRFPDYPDGYITMTPFQFSGDNSFFIGNQHGDFQHGDFQHGGRYTKFVANHIEEARDWYFNIGTNLRSTFFIGGSYEGDFANVDINRKDEFRQLILTIKPVQTVGFLLINYI